jgi:glutathione S-transferase
MVQRLVRDFAGALGIERGRPPLRGELVGPEEQRSTRYRRLQPFGQASAFEEDGLKLFESRSIVMHIAERSEAPMPSDSEDALLDTEPRTGAQVDCSDP